MTKEKSRLNEILSILARHKLYKGITPVKLREIFEELGATYIKLGQIMSMRSDMLPKEYCDELIKLRTDVPPMEYSDVVSVVTEELKRPLEEVFATFDEKPLGSASIAEAHLATLVDGSSVVVKVQRVGIYETMSRDITLLRKAAKLLKLAPNSGVIDFDMVLDELWAVTLEELDFLREASNGETFANNNASVAYISCPKMLRKYSTSKVLVMEYVDGYNLPDKQLLLDNGYDLREIATKMVDNYVKQVIDDGFFHADPHQGNIKIRGGQIVWIDMGMMGKLSDKDKKLFSIAITAVADNDIQGVKNCILNIGVCHAPIDQTQLANDIELLISKYGSMGLGELDIAKIMEEVMNIANTHKISMPNGVSMLCRGIATIEGVLAELAPDISFVEILTNHVKNKAISDLDVKNELQQGLKSVYMSGKKSLDIPALLSDLLKQTAKGQTKIDLKVITSDADRTAQNNHRKRLYSVIISSALFISSSMLALSEELPRLWGLPTYSWGGYFLAFASLACGYFLTRKK